MNDTYKILPPPQPSEPSFWEVVASKTKAVGKWLARFLVGPGAALVVVLVAVLLVAMGFKNVQVGGLLGKIFGKKPPNKKTLGAANSIPEDRVDKDGKLILVGEADENGMTQASVVAIEKPGLFSDPDTVKFKPPGEEKPVEVKLPVGVKAKDVDKVVVVKPEHFVVSVKNSGVGTETVEDLMKRYL